MKILTVDIGTGTQDIFLYDSNLDLENGFKLVLPSPTMMVHRRLKQALHLRTPILLSGHQMGGGPSAWAIEEYARAGIPVYMTPPQKPRWVRWNKHATGGVHAGPAFPFSLLTKARPCLSS